MFIYRADNRRWFDTAGTEVLPAAARTADLVAVISPRAVPTLTAKGDTPEDLGAAYIADTVDMGDDGSFRFAVPIGDFPVIAGIDGQEIPARPLEVLLRNLAYEKGIEAWMAILPLGGEYAVCAGALPLLSPAMIAPSAAEAEQAAAGLMEKFAENNVVPVLYSAIPADNAQPVSALLPMPEGIAAAPAPAANSGPEISGTGRMTWKAALVVIVAVMAVYLTGIWSNSRLDGLEIRLNRVRRTYGDVLAPRIGAVLQSQRSNRTMRQIKTCEILLKQTQPVTVDFRESNGDLMVTASCRLNGSVNDSAVNLQKLYEDLHTVLRDARVLTDRVDASAVYVKVTGVIPWAL